VVEPLTMPAAQKLGNLYSRSLSREPPAIPATPDEPSPDSPRKTVFPSTVMSASHTSTSSIGHYALRRKLGQGGAGQVWLARDKLLNRDVAIKLLHPDAGQLTDNTVKEFVREAQAAARLNHPNTVTVYQVGKRGDQVFIAMEYVAGGSLADEVKTNGALPWPQATQAVRDAAAGLEAAHDAGLVHRDVKPSNLMRTPRGVVKVVDFGLAKRRDVNTDTTRTRPGTILGSPAYMAPEQCRGQIADARSDLYSLACTYYYLLTRELPFPGPGIAATLHQHCTQPFPDVRQKAWRIPEAVCRILERGAQKDPADRYQSAGEFLADLDTVLATPEGSHVFADEDLGPSLGTGVPTWAHPHHAASADAIRADLPVAQIVEDPDDNAAEDPPPAADADSSSPPVDPIVNDASDPPEIAQEFRPPARSIRQPKPATADWLPWAAGAGAAVVCFCGYLFFSGNSPATRPSAATASPAPPPAVPTSTATPPPPAPPPEVIASASTTPDVPAEVQTADVADGRLAASAGKDKVVRSWRPPAPELASPPGTGPAANLFIDGSFSDDPSRKGWSQRFRGVGSVPVDDSDAEAMVRDTQVFKSAPASLRLTSTAGNRPTFVEQYLKKLPPAPLKITGSFRSTGTSAQATVKAFAINSESTCIGNCVLLSASGAADWTDFSQVVIPPAGTDKLKIAIFFDGEGTLWVDDFTAVPLESKPADTAAAQVDAAAFDGRDLHHWKSRDARPNGAWSVGSWNSAGWAGLAQDDPAHLMYSDAGGVLVTTEGKGEGVDLLSDREFADCEVHAEFLLPKGANSGIFLMGLYEMELRDKPLVSGRQLDSTDCGAICHVSAPMVDAAKSPGEWQTVDVTFRAPRFAADGTKVQNARFLTVLLNGQEVQRDVEVMGPTDAQTDPAPEKRTGPLLLQGRYGPAAFRNVQVRPLRADDSAAAAPHNTLTDAERAAGWKLLFDGETLSGWRGYKRDQIPDNWLAKDGALSNNGDASADLITTDQYANFDLTFDFNLGQTCDSGVMYRVLETTEKPYGTGPEYQLVTANAGPASAGTPLLQTAACARVYPPTDAAPLPSGQWNTGRIVVNRNHVEHWLNGKKVVEYELGSPDWTRRVNDSDAPGGKNHWDPATYGRAARGHICLQGFANRPIAFRNLKIRPLPD